MAKTMIPVVFQEDKIDFKLTSIIFEVRIGWPRPQKKQKLCFATK